MTPPIPESALKARWHALAPREQNLVVAAAALVFIDEGESSGGADAGEAKEEPHHHLPRSKRTDQQQPITTALPGTFKSGKIQFVSREG